MNQPVSALTAKDLARICRDAAVVAPIGAVLTPTELLVREVLFSVARACDGITAEQETRVAGSVTVTAQMGTNTAVMSLLALLACPDEAVTEAMSALNRADWVRISELVMTPAGAVRGSAGPEPAQVQTQAEGRSRTYRMLSAPWGHDDAGDAILRLPAGTRLVQVTGHDGPNVTCWVEETGL